MKGKHIVYVCLRFIHLMNRTREQKQGLEEEKEPGSFTDSGEKERVLPLKKVWVTLWLYI